jgi:hypothetical protein
MMSGVTADSEITIKRFTTESTRPQLLRFAHWPQRRHP